jgi:hypothetical protein
VIGQRRSNDEFAGRGAYIPVSSKCIDYHLQEPILSVIHSELASRVDEYRSLVLVWAK